MTRTARATKNVHNLFRESDHINAPQGKKYSNAIQRLQPKSAIRPTTAITQIGAHRTATIQLATKRANGFDALWPAIAKTEYNEKIIADANRLRPTGRANFKRNLFNLTPFTLFAAHTH
jgi:hypothetical protein